MSKKNKLALIDFDGTLYDTVAADHAAYEHALKAFGHELDFEFFRDGCFGGYYKNFLRVPLGEDYDALVEPVHDLKMEVYPGYFGLIRENGALVRLLESIKDEYYLVIVSTGNRKSMEEILSFFGRRELFDEIIDQTRITRKKPEPDAFLTAMEQFGIAPEDTIVFEDAEPGVQAAKAAGLQYFRVEEILSL
jgi:beta-phosphoglucomutase-like phosphatase (HAD superfamily)